MTKTFFFFVLLAWLGAAQFVSAAIRLVTNTADSGAGSLRDTIAAATAGDTIQFSGMLVGQLKIVLITPLGGEGNLVIDKDLTIDTRGRVVLIDGNHTSRAFYIDSGIVNLSGLTITNGFDYNGGGG